MKTVGLLGSRNYKKATMYLEAINQKLKTHFREKRTAKVVLNTIDVSEISRDKVIYSKELIYYSTVLREAGAHILVLCDDLDHEYAKSIRRNINMPLVHIGEAVGERLKSDNIKKALLIGSREIMQADFFIAAMNRSGVTVHLPPMKVINEIHEMIEKKEDPIKLISMIESFRMKGVSGVVLTEDVGIDPSDLSINVYNSFDIHVDKIVNEIMKGII
ncbi:hypothetical protein EZV73_03465 [Acidaminobacter sp. JC074]|uniref:aspartate/glutamate racemase family protein n=1 Tax=Acidaminobacter sp. JC074 TaxID=2530199 RepID=UPI001F0F8FC9|nr:aspartate/glutamate racemase family protein [Acidaminobacter sp. JC074]MCH4886608.1 hypothetical protein [Acidaminobacter sp. JC074]